MTTTPSASAPSFNDTKLRALRKALDWLALNSAPILKPFPDWMAGIKRIAEATMLANSLLTPRLQALDPDLAKHANAWLGACWKVLREGDYLVEQVDLDPQWVCLALTYAQFHKNGKRNATFEARLAELADYARGDSFLLLGVAAAYDYLGVKSRLRLEELTADAFAVRMREYQLMDPKRAYETTHVVFWLHPIGKLTETLSAKLRSYTPGWIEHYMRAKNHDIVAELIAMGHLVGAETSEHWFKWLLSYQDPDGSFPGVEMPNPVLGRWHPTLVAALALAICLDGTHCACAEKGTMGIVGSFVNVDP